MNTAGIHNGSPPSSKISLFRSLFRGREDLYPRRFESQRTGNSGYFPACRNAWVRGICEKPKIKCVDCRYRSFFSVTDEVVSWHLSGRDDRNRDFVMGVYPMLLNETCFFLAVDFDKTHWEKDSLSFMRTCHQLNVPAALERSRSGRGAHIWLFFAEAVPAILARKLASSVLTETMESHPEIGLDSYDRFFPSQDTLPQGGFGNLIALPLQKKAREQGNSIFVNEDLVPHNDQWVFLSQVQKMTLREVEEHVRQAEAKGRVIGMHLPVEEEGFQTPWARRTGCNIPSVPHVDLPESLEVVIGSEIFIQKKELPPSVINRLIRLAAFPNPEFYKAQAMRLSTHEKPRMISCAVDYPDVIAVPRGCFDDVRQLCLDLKISMSIHDDLQKGNLLKIKFLGELRGEQKRAAEEMLKTNIGVLSATTAFGKTVIGAWLIAKRKVNTLILVHRKQLQEQWVQRLSTFLELPKDAIGYVGGGRKKPSGMIDVALIQSLKGPSKDIVSQYGHLIVDECHHIPAFSFEQIVRQSKATYITGLTATPIRKDGHQPIIFMRCGPVRYRVDAKKAAALHPFDHTVFVRPTTFCPVKAADKDVHYQLHNLYEELIHDEERNQMICDEVVAAVKKGRSPIVLTERKEHLDRLFELISPHVCNLVVLRGGMSSKKMVEAVNQISSIPKEEERVILGKSSKT